MQSQNTKQEKSANNMTVYFQNVTVNFNSYVGIKQPDMTNENRFYKVYSPGKFKLRPREDIYLDLKLNIQTPETLEPWLNLLPSLKEMGLHIENKDWVSNKTKDNITRTQQKFQLYRKRKEKSVYWIHFLLGEKYTDIINTKYNLS